MSAEISSEIQTWPVDKFHNQFEALMEEEDRIVQQRASPRDCCHAYAYITEDSGEFGCWVLGSTSESLQARFELLATKSGLALGSPLGTLPLQYWLHRLFLDLRANDSNHTRTYNGTAGFIVRLFEASANYCARLDRRVLESRRKEVKEGATFENGGRKSVHERSERRSAVVMPILTSKGWKPGRWATKAGVGKNCVYEYLSGKRNLTMRNRQAMAEELGLSPEQLPD